MDPALICRAFFILAATAALGTTVFPSLQQLTSYGPRSIPASETRDPSTGSKGNNSSALDKFASFQVPHTWFTHFYVVSVASSAFWMYQLVTKGSVFYFLLSHFDDDTKRTMTMNQILITWVLMAFQGARRLLESIRLLKPSTTKMSVASYALGISFYMTMGVVVWVEGIPALLASNHPLEQITMSKPSAKTTIAVPLFLIASVAQYDSHAYLAKLKKYTLPEHRLFRWILCPHYTSECAIYLALAVVAAPAGQMLNKTILTVLIFTVVTLAITSESTRSWYAQKFGEEKIKQRSRMLPFLY